MGFRVQDLGLRILDVGQYLGTLDFDTTRSCRTGLGEVYSMRYLDPWEKNSDELTIISKLYHLLSFFPHTHMLV